MGKVQKGERLLLRSRRAGPVVKRDKGSGETEGVSPGVISRPAETQSGPGRIRGQNARV
jgi:hypothetical protein